MVVLHYITTIDQASGGVGAYMKLLARSLGKVVELHVVSHRSKNELSLENCTLHYIEKGLFNFTVLKRQFMELLDSIKPDIVHVNGCWLPMCSFVVFWAKAKGYPVIISPHGMLEPWVIAKNHWTKKLPALLLYQRRALKMADTLVATAKSEKENILKLGFNPKVALVPCGIDIDNIKLKETWTLTKNILYMGLLRPNKGAGILLDVVSQLKQELYGYRIVIAGPDVDGYLRQLQEKCERLGLGNIVAFPGGVYGDKKWRLLHEADFFVLPTLNENFGIVIAESLLCGTPVITCKGAPWSALETERCGWWKERTVEEVAKAMKQALFLSANELEAMGRRGNKYVRNNFSSDKVAVEMTKLYELVLSKSAHSRINAQPLTIDNGGANHRLTFICLAALYDERRAA